MEETIKFAAVILQAAAIIVTAAFAIIGLRAWRSQMLGKRKLEVAEEALVIAHKIRNAISYARLPVRGPGEGWSRQVQPGESEFGKLRDSYHAPIERLRAYDEEFAKLEKQRLLCETYFGPDASKPLVELAGIRRQILAAARGLLALPFDRALKAEEMASVVQWEAAIWDFGDRMDEVSARANSAVEAVEAICKPHLQR